MPARIAVAPMATSTANSDGTPTEKTAQIYRERAACGAGLVIVEHNAVALSGAVRPSQLRADTKDAAKAQRALSEIFESAGVPAIVQINHCGGQPSEASVFEMEGYRSISPSGVKIGEAWNQTEAECHVMSASEIKETVEQFVNAAVRMVDAAGYEGIQIHACHGYLLGQFLSPRTNMRDDAYGGTPYKRAKLLYEITDSIRQSIPGAVLSVRLAASDTLPDEPKNGLSLDETVPIARELANLGVDLICVSGNLCGYGGWRKDEAYFAPYAQAIREAAGRSVPVICTGGIRSAATAEKLLREGVCDIVGVGRPLSRATPFIPNWKEELA